MKCSNLLYYETIMLLKMFRSLLVGYGILAYYNAVRISMSITPWYENVQCCHSKFVVFFGYAACLPCEGDFWENFWKIVFAYQERKVF